MSDSAPVRDTEKQENSAEKQDLGQDLFTAKLSGNNLNGELDKF